MEDEGYLVPSLGVFGKVGKEYREAMEDCLSEEDKYPKFCDYSASYMKEKGEELCFVSLRRPEKKEGYDLKDWTVSKRDLLKYHEDPEKVLSEFKKAYDETVKEERGGKNKRKSILG